MTEKMPIQLFKACRRCGKTFYWSRMRRASWQHVEVCGAFCAARPLDEQDAALERAIVYLLRVTPAHFITLEAAAKLVDADRWRELMGLADEAARRLDRAGRIEIWCGDRRADPGTARGPITLRATSAGRSGVRRRSRLLTQAYFGEAASHARGA